MSDYLEKSLEDFRNLKKEMQITIKQFDPEIQNIFYQKFGNKLEALPMQYCLESGTKKLSTDLR